MYKPTDDEVKEIMLINGESRTEQMEHYRTMLPLLFDHVKEECNNTFGDSETTSPVIPGGVKIFMAKAIEFYQNKTGLRNRSMGTVSYSFESELPRSLYNNLRAYRKVRFRAQR
ncbi:hypothetical protein [Bacillus sp. ISL-45]|uniref:hypothetical protein n=1 Tax=Bacillus sp. ISL-45 TaxID=2819128 RepID=UPI001BE8A8E0|nr:hypothetical protein [Bacillus sp. ISL-45]MBT2661943.1 hypothetical protein [Bacillus sp. ISL-45]